MEREIRQLSNVARNACKDQYLSTAVLEADSEGIKFISIWSGPPIPRIKYIFLTIARLTRISMKLKASGLEPLFKPPLLFSRCSLEYPM